MNSPTPPRQRFRPGIDEIPDDVLEQIAHAGNPATCKCEYDGETCGRVASHEGAMLGSIVPLCYRCAKSLIDEGARLGPGDPGHYWLSSAARWAARLLGVEVR